MREKKKELHRTLKQCLQHNSCLPLYLCGKMLLLKIHVAAEKKTRYRKQQPHVIITIRTVAHKSCERVNYSKVTLEIFIVSYVVKCRSIVWYIIKHIKLKLP